LQRSRGALCRERGIWKSAPDGGGKHLCWIGHSQGRNKCRGRRQQKGKAEHDGAFDEKTIEPQDMRAAFWRKMPLSGFALS
jgi:hypothetical protein